jgi:Ca-activated chloride channel homolog
MRFLALAAVFGLTVAAVAEETSPSRRLTFGSEVEVVNLNLSVTDSSQQFVSDLKEAEIAVYEDGVRQTLCLFTRERLPLSLAVLIDTSSSMHPNMDVARAAALRLVRTLKPEDEASIVEFNQRHRVVQDFTADQGRLAEALQEVRADGTTGLYNALYVSAQDLAKRGTAGEMRRRALVVLSDGEDTSSLVSDDQVVERIRKSGVTVYAISLRPRRINPSADQHKAAYFLTSVARESGGRVYFPAALRDLDGVYDVVAEELRTQYGLGYVSTNAQRDGKWRRIQILAERASLLVRHRAGYYAPGRKGLPSGKTPATSSSAGGSGN